MAKFELVSKYDTEKYQFLIPQRQTQFSAGYDFKASKDILVKAGTMKPVLVPTGIKAKLERDQVLILANRSSNALKRGLIVPNGVGVIDADYYNNPDNEGEIMGMFINVGDKDYTIKQGDRIMQGIITAYSTVEGDKPAIVERKGGFGSTGKGNAETLSTNGYKVNISAERIAKAVVERLRDKENGRKDKLTDDIDWDEL